MEENSTDKKTETENFSENSSETANRSAKGFFTTLSELHDETKYPKNQHRKSFTLPVHLRALH